MEPWYRIATPRKEVREGRSFNPDEFAIHLELAKVVDDDAEAAVRLLVEEAFEEGRLARAEETGQEGHLHGNKRAFSGWVSRRSQGRSPDRRP